MKTWQWRAVILSVLLGLLAIFCMGCFAIPVRVVPTDEPILVAPVGVEKSPTGDTQLNPQLPQPDPAKFPPAAQVSGGWASLGNLLLAGVGILTGGSTAGIIALRGAGKLRAALSIATKLADDCAVAETDEHVEKAKAEAARAQEAAGVRTLTQKARGKA